MAAFTLAQIGAVRELRSWPQWPRPGRLPGGRRRTGHWTNDSENRRCADEVGQSAANVRLRPYWTCGTQWNHGLPVEHLGTTAPQRDGRHRFRDQPLQKWPRAGGPARTATSLWRSQGSSLERPVQQERGADLWEGLRACKKLGAAGAESSG
jgi:hypothetical protein